MTEPIQEEIAALAKRLHAALRTEVEDDATALGSIERARYIERVEAMEAGTRILESLSRTRLGEGNTPMPEGTDEERTSRALEVLEAMAETWVERTGVAQQVRSVPVNLPTAEFQERAYALILRWVKNAYVEGLYTGRTSKSGGAHMLAATSAKSAPDGD